ncbi:MAG: SDR family NAD(P)-dependent oxidoreductase, partial [Alphaproteobacteria bacterium]
MSDHELKGKTALVTGASSGFGRHFVEILAREGVRVAAAARRADRLDTLAREVESRGGSVFPVQMDVANSESVKEGVKAAYDALG